MISWSNDFIVGNDDIDNQHRLFLNLINRFVNARVDNAGNEKLHRILHELLKYAEFHFYSEENLMIECHDPHVDIHKAMHTELLDTLRDNVYAFELGEHQSVQVEDFLFDWFTMHTLQEDKKINFYDANSIQAHI